MTTTSAQGVTALATGPAREAVAAVLASLDAGLAGRQAKVVAFFASSHYDPQLLAGPLSAHFPHAQVIGCSTAGEFTQDASGVTGISAIALHDGQVERCVAALAELGEDPYAAVQAAVGALDTRWGAPLRDVGPEHLGLVLIDGMHGHEELVSIALGDALPHLDVVGGSAGDDLRFDRTWVSVGDEVSFQGAALLVARMAAPFVVLQSSSFRTTGRALRVTRADAGDRVVHELNGRPAALAYAEAVGCLPDELDDAVFMRAPLGLVIDGAPFVRSPQAVNADGSIRFYCQVVEGAELELMSSGDLVSDTAEALLSAVDRLGGSASASLLFNCILRRLEMDEAGSTAAFLDALGPTPAAGFHTYGETWLGHMNQTLTGVVIA
jgi:hypothetical protein